MRVTGILSGTALALAIALPPVSSGLAQQGTPPQTTINSIYVMNFEVVDLNSDKLVDRAEYDKLHNDTFYLFDGDRSGGLSIGEIDDVTPVQFNIVDSNRDGTISLEEYMNARAVDFAVADDSGDGMLSLQEVKDWAGEEDEGQ